MDSLLRFNAHVDEICRKAGRKLNVLARLSKSMSTECKLMLFYSLLAAQFEYCAVLWHFHDFNSSYEQLLSRSNRNTLCVQRLRLILSIVYKSVMKQGPMYVNDLFVINENSKSRRYFPLVQPQFKIRRYDLNSFRYQASHFWNLLEYCFKDPTALRKWEPQCGCTNYDTCFFKKSVMYKGIFKILLYLSVCS